jgi:polyisoprenyl-teichoic acid--peptidoglycan teichoic acid transferase
MTDLKPSTEGGAHNPSAPSEPSPTNIHPAKPTKLAQSNGAQTAALTKPAQPSAAQPRGLPIDSTSAPPETAPPTSAASRESGHKPCPNCEADNSVGALFCESCGYDFTTGAMPRPLVAPGSRHSARVDVASLTKPAQPSAPQPASPIKPSPAKSQPAAPVKPAQPNGARPVLPTKPAQPSAAQSTGPTKPNPAKSQPAAPVKPAQPSAAQATAPTKPGPAATAPPPAAPTKPTQTNAAQTAAPTEPGPGVTQQAPPPKAVQPGVIQTAVATKPSPASTQAAAPSEPSLSSAPAGVPGWPSSADSEPAAAPPKRRRALPIVLGSVAATLVAVLAIAAIFVSRVESSLTQNLDREDLMPTDSSTAPHPTKEPAAADALNFVVMGHDSRDPSIARSGSLMILHLNAKRDQAYFISFPRDTWVSIPGHGSNKINAAYSIGGTKLTVSTLEKLTDTRMDHAALVDFQGFAKLTDEVGGVTVYNKTAFSSHGVHYPQGNITVSGERALYFVGERKALPRGDFDRATNERNLIKAILAKTLSTKIITDPGRLLSVVTGTAEHLTVDNGLTNSKIRSTVISLRLTDKDIHLMTAPISSKANRRGQPVDVVDKAKLAELRTALREDRVNEYLAKYPQG